MLGTEKRFIERNPLKRIGYLLFGEIHVPGRIRINHVLKEIGGLGLPERGVRVLDAGCGKGTLLFALARRYPNWQIKGIELLEDRYQDAVTIKRRLDFTNVEIERGDLLELREREIFDLIICSDVLEHVEDDVRVIENLVRALKKGGYLILTAPSIPQRKHLWLVKWREKKTGFHPSQYGHVRDGYSIEDFVRKLKPFGMEEIVPRYTFGPFGTLAFDIFFVIGDNRPNPFVFAIFFPFLLLLAAFDVRVRNGSGSGLLVRAKKGGNSAKEG